MNADHGNKKGRHLKTLYERFSHHKVGNLEELKNTIKETLRSDYLQRELDIKHKRTNKVWSLWEALDRLNIQYSGKFYVNAEIGERGYSDVYCFMQAFEKTISKQTFPNTSSERLMEVRVLGCDYKDAVLVVYESASCDTPFYIHILRDKHSDVLLEGNIAHIV